MPLGRETNFLVINIAPSSSLIDTPFPILSVHYEPSQYFPIIYIFLPGEVRSNGDGSYEAYMIPPNKANHASFIEALPTGDLIIAWFSGTAEGENDVSIYTARLPMGSDQWTNASLVSRRDGYSNQNPVLYYDPSTKIINLWHSQQPADKGESDANVWHLQSTDGQGVNWTKPVDLLTKPGSFDRNRVIPSLDGGLILPVYYSGII